MKHLSIAAALVIALSSVAVAGQARTGIALQAAGDALERAISVGSEELVPKEILRMAEMDEVFFIHHPETLEPSYGLVPIRSPQGGVVGVIAVDAGSRTWRWMSFSYLGEEFPSVGALEARRKVEARRRLLGKTGELGTPVLMCGHDKHLYWRFESGETSWLVDAFRLDVSPVSSADAPYSRVMTPAPSLVDPNGSRGEAPANLSAPGEDALLTAGITPAYCIPGVPYHYQITGWYCGEASVQMMMDFYGEEIGQHDIGDVANEAPSYGTMDTDCRRAAHFSGMSTAIQNGLLQGYTERKLGYAAIDKKFFSNQGQRLKNTIYAGYPVFTLTYYDGSQSGGHYRVVKGYDDSLDVFVIHDPWYAGYLCGPDLLIEQDFFVNTLWVHSGHWCMVASPWILTPDVPASVSVGDTFSVDLKVLYPGPTRFGGSFPCSSCTATIGLSPGLTLAGGSATISLPDMDSNDSASVAWDVVAVGPAGDWGMAFQAHGIVQASSSSYASYSDSIGGHSYATVDVGGSLLAGWGPEERLTTDSTSSITCFPGGRAMVVSDDGTVHLVWSDMRDDNSEVYYRKQSGGTWEAEVRLTDDPSHSHSPCIAEDANGNLHVAWVDHRIGNYEIYYKSWTPGGGWSADERVTNYGEVDCFPSIAANDSLVHIAWESRQGGFYRAHAVFHAYRNALTWSLPIDVDASPARDSFRPSLAIGADSLLHIAYERHTSNTPNELEKVVHKSWDGILWSSRTGLSSVLSYSRTPSIAAGDDGTLHVVWQDGENVGGDIFYSKYDGIAWQVVPDQIVTGVTESSTPSVAVDADGDVYVVWVDYRHSESEIYLMSNDGSGWSAHTRFTSATGSSMLPCVCATGNGLVSVLWTDLRHGSSEIYFRGPSDESGIPADPGQPAGALLRLSLPHPQPFTREVRLSLTVGQATDISLEVFDITGRTVRTLTDREYGAGEHTLAWDGKDGSGRDVASGVYFVRCSSALGSATRRIVCIR